MSVSKNGQSVSENSKHCMDCAIKVFAFQKKAIRAVNNLACNEHTNAYLKCYKIVKLSDQYIHKHRGDTYKAFTQR